MMTRTTCQKRYLVLNLIFFYCEYIKSKFDLTSIILLFLYKREIGKPGFDPAFPNFPWLTLVLVISYSHSIALLHSF